MIAILLKFYWRLIMSVTLLFGLHISVLWYQGLTLFDHFIIPSYLFNTFITLVFFTALLFSSREKNLFLGWVFFCYNWIKIFGILFLNLSIVFCQMGHCRKMEFFTFFYPPYSLCLIIEIHQLSKILNTNT